MNRKWNWSIIASAVILIGLSSGCIGPDGNRPPGIPSISLPAEATVNEEVKITVRSVDPNGDRIAYKVRYGDGIDSEWSEYLPSSQETTFIHKYKKAGNYRIKAVASDREAIGEWSEDKWIKIKTSLLPRLISILGTCLPGCEEMWKELGGTHFYGNRYGWPDYDEVERLGMKVFVNIRADDWRFSLEEQEELSRLRDHLKTNVMRTRMTGVIEPLSILEFKANLVRYRELILKSIPNDGEIQRAVNAWKDRPVCGGYWNDSLGHEPDITNPPMEERERFYNTVRKYDPDVRNHPVMEMMNNTAKHDGYPGWTDAFSDKTHDLLLFDCYPGMSEGAIKGMGDCWNRFIKVFPKQHQVIPQMQAYSYQKGGIWRQYNFWREKMASAEFDNPYRGQIGVCWYLDSGVRQDPEMQREIAEVNAEIAK